MKFYFENDMKRVYLTLKRGSYKWVNYDCPDIYREDGIMVFHNGGLNGWYGFIEDENILKQFRKFVIASDKTFCKKYPNFIFEGKEGHLVKNLDKEISLI